MVYPDRRAPGMPPSLLACLRIDAPAPQQVPGPGELRRQVLRDLQWLLNSHHYASCTDLRPYAHVQRSVLNFGVPTLAGVHLSAMVWPRIQQDLTTAILRFEPRIVPQGLQVRYLAAGDVVSRYSLLSIEIQGQLRSEPAPLPFLFHSQLDLENGHVALTDVG